MEAESIRINLGKDQWWNIKPVQTQGMRKLIKKNAQKELLENLRTSGASSESTEVIDLMALNDAVTAQTLIIMSTEWSWPEPINTKTLENRESWQVDAVLTRMNELYTRTPEQIKALEKNLLEPS